MTDTDLHPAGLGPLRAAAEAAELGQAVTALAGIDGCRPADSDPLAPLARDVARQGVRLVPNSNSIVISVTDGEFFDGMRFARTGWPGTHGPWRVCLAMSGHALEDGLEAAGPGEVAEDSVEVCGWRREGLVGCLQRPRSLCAGTFGTGQARPRGQR
jgi:hypothetical protein